MNHASFDFTDAVVLITGGDSGIGLAMTRAFLDAGATVAVTGRRKDRLEQSLEGYPAERTAAGHPTIRSGSSATITDFVRSLALGWGEHGVRLNAVAPVFTLTDLTEGVGRDEQSPAPFLNRIALGRPGRPEDVALPVLFLASDAAR